VNELPGSAAGARLPFSPNEANPLGERGNPRVRVNSQRTVNDSSFRVEHRRKLLTANPKDAHRRQLLDESLTLVVRAADGLGRTDEMSEAKREQEALRASAAPR
jgi:hypothetical protein